MSFIVLHADRFATALTEDPVIPAADVPLLNSVVDLLDEAHKLHSDAGRQADAARREAREQGYAAGHGEGLEAARAEIRAELFALAMRDGEERRRQRGEIASLALEVVRRIAGEIGGPALVAGLAERATAALVPETVATVRVAPAHVDDVAARLAARPGFTVEGDPSLAPTDCVVETALGRTHAGLETQLAQIEVAWAGTSA